MGNLRRSHLIAYNSIMAVGWGGACVFLLQHLLTTGALEGGDAACLTPVQIVQLVALVDVLNALFGIVGGSAFLGFLFWLARLNITYGVLAAAPELKPSPVTSLMCLAWSANEGVRYAWTLAKTVTRPPGWLTAMRYSLFVPLFPIGAGTEAWLIYKALPTLQKRTDLSVSIPGLFFISYYQLSYVLLILYPFVFVYVFYALLANRRRALRKEAAGGSDARGKGKTKSPAKTPSRLRTRKDE